MSAATRCWPPGRSWQPPPSAAPPPLSPPSHPSLGLPCRCQRRRRAILRPPSPAYEISIQSQVKSVVPEGNCFTVVWYNVSRCNMHKMLPQDPNRCWLQTSYAVAPHGSSRCCRAPATAVRSRGCTPRRASRACRSTAACMAGARGCCPAAGSLSLLRPLSMGLKARWASTAPLRGQDIQIPDPERSASEVPLYCSHLI